MKCKLTDCSNHEDCIILDITKKQPKDSKSCSYFKTQQQLDKQIQKQQNLKEEVKHKKSKPKF
jgi:hypothetical protein